MGTTYAWKMESKIKSLAKKTWLPHLFSGAGAAAYIIQILLFAHTQDSILDEGLYLLKGYWFAAGKYVPFQPYGPWTNKMPLSFLIPGVVQRVFGPGLRTGRYYAVAVSLLILLGVYIVARRSGGVWGAAGAVVLIALNPALLKLYSMVLSEGLIALMLIWVMVLVVGENRPLWQLLSGSFLAGAMVITRQNMVMVLPIVLGYIVWEHGLKKGIWSSLAGLMPVLVGHALYWPRIMGLWVRWVPEAISPFLDPFRIDFPGAVKIYDPEPALRARILAFFEGVRFHFAALFGSIATLILWPEEWKRRSLYRSSVALAVLFCVLLVMHIYGSILSDFNVFGFFIYLAFFAHLGILLITATIGKWTLDQPGWKGPLMIGLVITLSAGVFYSYAGPSTPVGKMISFFLLQPIPGFLGGSFFLSDQLVWQGMYKAFGLTYAQFIRMGTVVLLLGLEYVGIRGLIWLVRKKTSLREETSISSLVLLAAFSFGVILSPTNLLGGGMDYLNCHMGVISQHEQAARRISSFVEEGEEIFWVGEKTQVVLLDVLERKEVSFFPQQMNAVYSRRRGGDPDKLARHGYWNEALAADWLQRADVVLVEKQPPGGEKQADVKTLGFEAFQRVGETGQIGCEGETSLVIYRRKP